MNCSKLNFYDDVIVYLMVGASVVRVEMSRNVYACCDAGGWQCATVPLLSVRVGVAKWRHSALVADRRSRTTSPATWRRRPRRARLIARQQCGKNATEDLQLLLPLLLLLAVPVQRVCDVLAVVTCKIKYLQKCCKMCVLLSCDYAYVHPSVRP